MTSLTDRLSRAISLQEQISSGRFARQPKAPKSDNPKTGPGRYVILGGPRCGKTTLGRALAEKHGMALRSTDDVMNLGWSQASTEVAGWIREPGQWVVEGVAAVRAIRKFLASGEKPDFTVIQMLDPKVPQTSGQRTMHKGVGKILAEIAPDLKRAGIAVLTEADVCGEG